MSLEGTITILAYLAFLSATAMPVTVYHNARFNPMDTRYMMSSLSSTRSANDCLCQCYNNIICFTATYFGINQTCLLFFAQLSQGQLRIVPTIFNANVYYFGNRSFPALQFFNCTNDNASAIWNTTAGGNSSPAVSGSTMGTYWPTEPPEAAFDNNMTSEYTNHGSCNSGASSSSMTCGENTGLYLTLNNGPIILVAFYFVTNTLAPQRDPLTITIEGSNMNGSALTLGSSWTLIYNGSTGLITAPGKATLGTLQVLSNFSMRFASYRLLITSKRGSQTCVSYTEFVIIGY